MASQSDAAPTYSTCTFVQSRGLLCGSPALNGHSLCLHHHRESIRRRTIARHARAINMATFQSELAARSKSEDAPSKSETEADQRFQQFVLALNTDLFD